MIELRLRIDDQGRFVPATRIDFERATAAFDPGTVVNAKLTKRRSTPQNAWFHAVVQRAFANQTGGPSREIVPTWEHLKHWLLIEVGHCSVDKFEPEALTPRVAAWLRRRDPTVQFFVGKDHCIYAKTALSVSYRACGPAVFTQVANDVIDIIAERIVPGTQREDWEPQHFDERYGKSDWAQAIRARAARQTGNHQHEHTNQ